MAAARLASPATVAETTDPLAELGSTGFVAYDEVDGGVALTRVPGAGDESSCS